MFRRFISLIFAVIILAFINHSNPEWYRYFIPIAYEDGMLYVNYIDVGQGDSIFIACDGKTMLIDTGERDYADKVIRYMKRRGFSRIDVLVGTHPHSDHIGGMAAIIRSMEIGDILMPMAQNNTETFENTLEAISEKKVPVYAPTPGDTFEIGSAEVTVLAPFKASGGNLNNDSIVLKVVFGEQIFILTGDAEADVEYQILTVGFDVSANVLKVGHHGSVSSTSDHFLNAVAPEIAVISLGDGNSYGHPHKETLAKLSKAGVVIYRTDIHGSILISTDGTTYQVKTGQR